MPELGPELHDIQRLRDDEAYSVPDEFIIKYEGNVVYTTGGQVSGGASITVNLPAGTSTQIEVTVNGPSGTAWDYTVNCPAPPA